MLGDAVAPVLEAHLLAAGDRLRRLRNSTAWHASAEAGSNPITPPPGLLLEPAFRCGAARLGEFGLSLDVWAYHTQFGEVIHLARAIPDVTIVLDHCGSPLGTGPFAGRRDELFRAWRADMLTLAACPNVVVKLGGLAMQVGGHDFDLTPLPPTSERLAAAWRLIIEICAELFDATRCMVESNFPADKGMCAYPMLWNAFKRLTAGASDADKAALCSGTAARVYRLLDLPEGLAPDLSPHPTQDA